MAVDFYDLLGVPEDASRDDIRDAFREKVREYHPDHNDDPRASAQFTALKKAYDTLGDPVERNAYDRMGHLDYVSKRLDGLPDPEKWAPAELDEDADGTAHGAPSSGSRSSGGATSGSASSSGSRATTGGHSTGSRSSTGSGSTAGAGSSAGAGTSTGSTARSGTDTGPSTGSSSRSPHADVSPTERAVSGGSSGSTRTRAASDGGATASVADYEMDPVVEWIARHRLAKAILGWRLLWFVVALYVTGLAGVASTAQPAVIAFVDRVLAAGADATALAAALERDGVPVVAETTLRPLLEGGDPGSLLLGSTALLVAGTVLLPAVVALLVYVTRTSPGWKPTYLYVLATLGPVAGLAAGLATTPPLAAELALFVVLPLGAFVTMLVSAFVRPRVLIAIQNARS